jgi:peptidoglycan/LPS O-acetylase OafA/YrhL
MASPPSSHLRLDVQGLRAIAVIAVVLFHAGIILPGGFVGVDMFFVISGFVITLTILRTKEKTGKISLKQFYLRRFRRLAPALAVVILFTLAASAFVLSPLGTQQNAALTALAAALSVGNIAIALTTGDYFDAPAELNPFLHTWSLGVEEQFYVVFPIAIVVGLFLARGRLTPRATVTWVVGLITAVSFALTVGKGLLPETLAASNVLGFYSPVTRAWEFGAGALIALWSLGRTRGVSTPLRHTLSILGFVGLVYSFVAITGQSEFPGLITLIPVLATAALIVAGTGGDGWGSKLLATKPMTAVGDWSYSIYLWHWPFVSLAKVLFEGVAIAAPLAALVSFAPAIAAYYLVEQRYRYRVFDTPRKLGAALAGFIGIPVVAAVFFWVVPTQVFSEELSSATETPVGFQLGCHVEVALSAIPEACEWFADPDRPKGLPLYVVGDSNVAHFADGLVEVAHQRNSDLTVMTARRCPFILDTGELEGNVHRAEECDAWEENVLGRLGESEPGVVIISASDIYWLGEIEPLRLAGQDLTPSALDLLDNLGEAYTNTVRQVQAAGHHAVLVQTVPHWVGPHEWDLADCSLWEVLSGCHETMPAEFTLTRAGDVRNTLERAGHAEGATVVDFLPHLCPNGTCHTRGEGYWLYRNANHISNPASIELVPLWLDVLP